MGAFIDLVRKALSEKRVLHPLDERGFVSRFLTVFWFMDVARTTERERETILSDVLYNYEVNEKFCIAVKFDKCTHKMPDVFCTKKIGGVHSKSFKAIKEVDEILNQILTCFDMSVV